MQFTGIVEKRVSINEVLINKYHANCKIAAAAAAAAPIKQNQTENQNQQKTTKS